MLKKFCTVAIVSLIAMFSFAQTDLMTKAINRLTEFAQASDITVSKAKESKELEKLLEDETLVETKDQVEMLKAHAAKKASELTLTEFGGKMLNLSVARPMESGATAKFASSDVDAHGIITSPDEGEHKFYNRAGVAYYVSGQSMYIDDQSGVVEIVECANGDVFIKDPVSRNAAGSWVKGTKEGNTISVAAAQPVSYSTNYSATLSIRWGQIDASGNVSKLADAPFVYTIDGNTISLQGTSGYSSDGTAPFDFLGIFWDDDDSFSGYGDAESVYTLNEDYQPASTELVVLPEGAQTVQWYSQYKEESSNGETKHKGNVNVAFVGDDVYVQGLAADFPDSWIKGTKDAQGVVTFSGLQFVGNYSTYNIWAVGVDPETGELQDFKMQYTAEPAALVSVNDLLENAKEDAVYYLGWYTAISLTAEEPVVVEPTIETGAPVDAPYYNNFDTQDEFDQFGVYDANEDNSTWELASTMARYKYNGTNDGDDWLVSPAIKLEAGKAYLFSIDAKSALSSYPERFEVKMGTEAKVSKLTTVVIEPTTVAVSSLTTYSAPLTITETGYYHIGVHAISDADQYYLYADNFQVIDGAIPAAVSDLKLEADGTNGTLSFVMPTKNAGGQDLSAEGLTYTYVLNDVAVAEQVAAPGQEVSLAVALKAGMNKVTVVAVNAAGASANAEANVFVSSTLSVPVTLSFATADDFAPFTVIDANEDGMTWVHNATASRPTARYKYSSSNTADDWMIAPAIKLTAGRTYILKYIATSYSASYPEKLEIKIGKGTTVAAMTQTIVEAYELSNDKTAETEVEFSVAQDGEYNIGLHAVSDPDMFYLDVDYITVEAGPLPEAPAAVSALTAEAGAQGALEATIKFTAPTKNLAGNTVDPLTAIAVVDELGTVIEVEPAVAGEQYSVKVENLTNGTHTWTVTAYNQYGNGSKATVSAFVGQDVPAAPEATLIDQKTSVKLQWEAVTEGANGGYINPAGVTYEIYSLVESIFGTSIGDKLGETQETSFEVTLNTDEGEMSMLQYAMRSVNAAGESGYMGTDVIIIGQPETVPYLESFAGGSINHYLWLQTPNGDSSWGLSTQASADADGGCAAFVSAAEGDESSLITGKITLAGVTNPILSFQSIVSGATLKVQAQKRDGSVVDLATIAASDAFTAQAVDLNSVKNEDFIMIRFTAVASAADQVIAVDAIAIRDVLDHNLEMSLSAPAKVKKGEKVLASVVVINQGANDATGYKVKVNDQEVTESETLASYASKIYTFEFETSIFDEAESLVLSAEVVYAQELKPEDNSDEVEVILVASSAAKVSDLQAQETEDGVVLTWTAPAASSETVTEDFEGFDHNTAAPHTVCTSQDGSIENAETVGQLGDWTCYDMDGIGVYTWNGLTWELAGDAMAFVVLEPAQLFAAESAAAMVHSGSKVLLCMDAAPLTGMTNVHNDDWLVSPELSGDAQTISFWVSELTAQYGAETYELYYSTTDKEIASFNLVASKSVADAAWEEVSFDVPAGAKYFAIRVTSADIFGMLIDDITYAKGSSAPESFNVYRNQVKVANVAESTYTDADPLSGSISYAVTAVYGNGSESAPVSVTIEYNGITTISSEKAFNVYSVDGKLVRKGVKMVNDLEPGVYVINNQKVTVK